MCIIRMIMIGITLLFSHNVMADPLAFIPQTKPMQPKVIKDRGIVANALSLGDVILQTVQTNPSLRSSSKAVKLAQEDIDLARANFRPNVSATAVVNHIQSNNDLTDQWSGNTAKTVGINAVQPLYRGGRTIADVNAKTELAGASALSHQGDVNDMVVEAVRAYMDVYRARKNVEVNSDNRERLSERKKATQAGYEVGQLTRTDTSQAAAFLAQAEAEYSRSLADMDVAMSHFRKVTGITGPVEVSYPDLDQSIIPQTLNDALRIAGEKNPLLLAMKKSLKAQDYIVDVRQGEFLPEVNLQAGVDATRDPVGTSSIDQQEQAFVSLNMTLPLYQSGVIRNQLRQAKIARAQIDADYEVIRRNVIDRVVSAWESYRAIDSQIKAREAQVNASRISQEGVNLEQTVGSRSILDVLDVNQDMRDAELALIDAKSEAIVNYYQLIVAMGLLDVNDIKNK